MGVEGRAESPISPSDEAFQATVELMALNLEVAFELRLRGATPEQAQAQLKKLNDVAIRLFEGETGISEALEG